MGSPREKGLRRWRRRERRRLVLGLTFVGAVVVGGLGLTLYARGRYFMGVDCRTLYGEAESAADTAAVDSAIVVRWGRPHAVTCGVIRRDSFPPLERMHGLSEQEGGGRRAHGG